MTAAGTLNSILKAAGLKKGKTAPEPTPVEGLELEEVDPQPTVVILKPAP